VTLIREIQKDLEGVADVQTVLRKCKILAARLKSTKFAQWVEWELNGYPASYSPPEYRRLAITYYASFISLGWRVPQAAVPLQVVPAEHREAFTYIDFREGIAKAVSLAGPDRSVMVQRPELIFAIQGKMYPEMECHSVWGEISHIEFEQLISSVKSRILDFSLRIESENSNAGEILPDTEPIPPEKLRPLVQNVFYGSVGAVAQNSEHFSQTVNNTLSPHDLTKFVAEFVEHIDELGLDKRQKQRAEAQLAALKAESIEDPDQVVVKQAGRTLRNITEGAIGSLLATATQPTVWHWIHQMLTVLSKK
jgi:AbiTii